MLVHQGNARTNQVNQSLASILAAIAGALNASAFQAVGFFSANMTGNVSMLSDWIARGNVSNGLFFLFILLAFIGGSIVSTLLISAGSRRGVVYIYAVNIIIEALLLSFLGLALLFLVKDMKVGTLILGLSFLMGFQNAVVTRISNARIRTTHISGIATDIGIELGHLFDLARGYESPDSVAENKARLGLHLTTLLSFLGGGIIGVLLYGVIGNGVLFIAAGILFLISASSMRKALAAAQPGI